ncbi:MAG: cache domain-containing protein, partial [Methanoregula sp.]|nr:cache domain-containing protein [Methanoregula sp.]
MKFPSAYIMITGFILLLVLLAGCSQAPTGTTAPGTTTLTIPAVSTAPVVPSTMTAKDLIPVVGNAAAYARENGRERALAAFNDPDGIFVQDGLYIFAEGYDGTALAEPFEPDIVGTNILAMKDSYGIPILPRLIETAKTGKGFVSYAYMNPSNNFSIDHKLSYVEDVDGTYYVGAGFYACNGTAFPATATVPASKNFSRKDLVTFVENASAYAKMHGREKALAAFNDPRGPFFNGELSIEAFDFNGTNLAHPFYSWEKGLNMLNYDDPDSVPTKRLLRDRAVGGGGFTHSVSRITAGNHQVFVPVLNYAVPVDPDWW